MTFMTLLGFIDDVIELPWRVKIILPAIAMLPLLLAYDGSTSVVTPRILHSLLGRSVELGGVIYRGYMMIIGIFCTNSINIYAGINGLEVG